MDVLNRCLIGVRPPASWIEGMTQLQREFRRRAGDDVRPIPESEWLLVVVALGELRVDQMARYQQVVAEIAAQAPPSLSLRSGGPIGLPNATMPKSVALRIDGDTQVLQIIHTAASQQLSLPPAGEFSASIEIAKSRTGNDRTRADMGRAIRSIPPTDFPAWTVSGLEFLRASAGPTGPEYQLINSLPFSVQ
ncbi:MAG: hypothetical protein KF812_08820 [Fimbriimonadaceae bacterium]|nr:hypothetical protein [Fimbriimonadaceae bacterium]